MLLLDGLCFRKGAKRTYSAETFPPEPLASKFVAEETSELLLQTP